MLTSTPASYAEGRVPSTLPTTEGALFVYVLYGLSCQIALHMSCRQQFLPI